MVQPESIVYHVGGGTLNAASPFKTYLNFRNNLYMLFKNLTTTSLFTVILTRLILDGVAAISFLNQPKGFQHLLAIVKAHLSFFFAIPKLLAKRQMINQRSKLSKKMDWSLLYKNKILGIKRFSDL